MDRDRRKAEAVKLCLVYPLQRSFRQALEVSL
jgi:hypothetical protein